ncbi:translation initiation factor IF-2-like [Vulpes lagopus]|uniref:translation initiation factor IF-2-like n=1 Tax=Vulpes lagopus TaxID=494514 RepID=UPI001BC8F930|nr:translation initiation factor IF-2-like [Vulpes lagopus]
MRELPALRPLPRRRPRPSPLWAEPHPARRRGSRWLLLASGSGPPDAAQKQPAVSPPLPAAAAATGTERSATRAGSSAGAPAGSGRGGRAQPGGAGAVRAGTEPCRPRKSKKMVKGRANKLASGMEMQTDGWGCMDTDTQGKPKLFSLLICPAASQWCPFSAAAFPASGAAVMVEADGY